MAGVLYSRNKPYGEILEEVHRRMRLKMLRNQHKKEALELQTILQEIKRVAADFDNLDDSVIGQELKDQYQTLIELTFNIQSKFHSNNFKASTLFRRGHKTKTIAAADNIFEEDLAALLTAGELLGGNENINIEYFLFGTKGTGTKSTRHYNPNDLIDDEKVEKLLQQLAEKEQRRISTQVRDATGKIDISGKAVTLQYSKNLPFKVERLMQLMKDATFSAKSYTSRAWDLENKKDWSEIGLHLGNSNLYKAVTGALSEVQMGYKQQNSFFFRGINTILNNSHGLGDITATHFSHLRFIYELRGSGLLDENGLIMPVKFLIYNDPSSDAIYVKSTASIILEALDNATRGNNLLGDISLSASKVQSK